MTTYVIRKGEVVEKGGPLDIQEAKGTGPNIISDNMEPLKHHGNGRMIDSKRAFSKTTRDLGLVEIGNEKQERKPAILSRDERARDIKNTIEQLKSR